MAEQSLRSVLMSRANYHMTGLSVHSQWTVSLLKGIQQEVKAGKLHPRPLPHTHTSSSPCKQSVPHATSAFPQTQSTHCDNAVYRAKNTHDLTLRQLLSILAVT